MGQILYSSTGTLGVTHALKTGLCDYYLKLKSTHNFDTSSLFVIFSSKVCNLSTHSIAAFSSEHTTATKNQEATFCKSNNIVIMAVPTSNPSALLPQPTSATNKRQLGIRDLNGLGRSKMVTCRWQNQYDQSCYQVLSPERPPASKKMRLADQETTTGLQCIWMTTIQVHPRCMHHTYHGTEK